MGCWSGWPLVRVTTLLRHWRRCSWLLHCELDWGATTTSRERWLCFPTQHTVSVPACCWACPCQPGGCQEINITYVSVCMGMWEFAMEIMHLLGIITTVCTYVCIYLEIIDIMWCVEVLPLLWLWLLWCVPFRLACVYLYNSESDYWVLLIITTNEHNLDNLEKCQIVQENLNHSPDTSRGADWLHEQ